MAIEDRVVLGGLLMVVLGRRWLSTVTILVAMGGGLAVATEAPRRAAGRAVHDGFPYNLVSSDRLLADLEELTAIRPHGGWRSCGSRGEAEARAWVADRLAEMGFLASIGLEVEESSFRTIAGMEMWQSRLELIRGGGVSQIPADAPTGDPYRIWNARAFDSDGGLTDRVRDPIEVAGPPLVIRSADEIDALAPAEVDGRVVFVDFALFDWMVVDSAEAYRRITTLTGTGPGGLVAVTTGSNRIGDSHGTFAGDSSLLNYAQISPPIPILFTRVEDVVSGGAVGWAAIEAADAARLVWDADIVTPGRSGNVIARIPGVHAGQPVILSAHLDSPNSPGALDNGSGSVSLLEVARVLDQARIQPATDLYLVWFGCHERGLHGSPHFAATHQEILDDALAIVELDAMARPLDGFGEAINLESRSYAEFGDFRLPLSEYLQDRVVRLGIDVETWDFDGVLSDITGFVGYDVPNALLDNLEFPEMDEYPAIHYVAHWHDPYDTVELARQVAPVFEELTRVMLAAVLETGRDAPDLRVTPDPIYRAVLVGSHTEPVEMSPFTMTGFGRVLAWAGFDIDLIPYGQPVTAADLEGADLVVALPVLDYANGYGDVNQYDEAWTPAELDVLEDFVDTGGGWLVLTNTGSRLWFSNITREANEDWGDVNALAQRFGVAFVNGPQPGTSVETRGQHDLIAGVDELWTAADNAVPFVAPNDATVFAAMGSFSAGAVFPCGAGGVIVLADLGMLGDGTTWGENWRFWQNLAEWAKAPP